MIDGAGAIEARLRDWFGSHGDGVTAAYLFGSVARDQARAASDVDVAVLYAVDPPRTFAGLPLDLEASLEVVVQRPVQVVVLNAAPPDLVHRVLRDGRLLLDTNKSARIAFEVRARNEYFDVLPMLERYRRVGSR